MVDVTNGSLGSFPMIRYFTAFVGRIRNREKRRAVTAD